MIAYFLNIQVLETSYQFIERQDITEAELNTNNYLPVLVGRVIFEFAFRVIIAIKSFAEYQVMYITDIYSHIGFLVIVIDFKLIAKP